MEANSEIQVLGQILVDTFPEASEQTAPVEMFFKVTDHTGRGLESWEMDDFTITVNDGGVKRTLGNEHITYVGTAFTSFNPGNFKVNYEPVSFGSIMFTGTFRKGGYFDGKAEKVITLKTSKPIFYDSYKDNHITGSVIIIDEATNNTVGAGMII